MQIRDIAGDDLAAALLLNNEEVPAVNGHDEESFRQLLALAERTWVVDDSGVLAGLMVTFGPGAQYQSLNYLRLSDSYDNFAYVDRIVVAPIHRRRGVAGRLYETLATHARSQARNCLLCEVNVAPPNPASVAFHELNGWSAIEDHEHVPGKVVRYYKRGL